MNGSQAIVAMCHGSPFNTSAVAKLVKSEIFSEYHIRYDIAIHYSEDALLYYMLFKHADKITYCSTPFYKYFANPHSITRTTDLTEKVKTCFLAYDKMLSMETSKRIRLCLLSRVVMEAFFKLIYCIEKQDYHSDAYQYLRSILKRNLLYLVFDRRCKFTYKASCVMIVFPKLFRVLYSIYTTKKT
ncbi:MAG: hypothetical protein Ta2B_17600 [Termitinemataceae bacterium]|nr:MAG: hypothetical protein Ta2B_17600 [Termitinemataceae bacterium]